MTNTGLGIATPGVEAEGLTGLSAGWKLGPFILARAHSSRRPSLIPEADGLHYRVLRASTWAYPEIGAVDLRRMLIGVRIGFEGGGRFLWADFRDMASAGRFLARLPASVALKPRAAAARDCHAG